MAPDPELGTLLAVAGVFAMTLFLVWFLRRRRRQLSNRGEVPASRVVLEDRAFNQIQLARSAMAQLTRDGIDVGELPALLDRAELARSRGDPDTASALAQSARETLVHLRTSAPGRTSSVSRAPGSPVGAAASSSPSASAGPVGALPDTPPPARLPPNKAESRFQMNLLSDDLSNLKGSASQAPEAKEGRTLLSDAQGAFDRGQFTEALRLALRGRRKIGGRLETLAPGPGSERPGPGSDGEELSTEEAAAASCPSCGTPMKASDQFCRGCGASRSAPKCGKCGESLSKDDRFCGVCGEPVRT